MNTKCGKALLDVPVVILLRTTRESSYALYNHAHVRTLPKAGIIFPKFQFYFEFHTYVSSRKMHMFNTVSSDKMDTSCMMHKSQHGTRLQ
jgi:hypothetical protein